MKSSGPLNCGPGSETKRRVAGEHPLTRSAQGPATPPVSSPRSTAPISVAAAPARLEIVLKPRGRGRFDALFQGRKIVSARVQAITDAARVLHRAGYPDAALLIVRHHGADHDAISGPLGVWRKVRVREDRGPPRHVPWQPFPSRPVTGAAREIVGGG